MITNHEPADPPTEEEDIEIEIAKACDEIIKAERGRSTTARAMPPTPAPSP
jgi:hypothetical protein